jgi:hypothetical protein
LPFPFKQRGAAHKYRGAALFSLIVHFFSLPPTILRLQASADKDKVSYTDSLSAADFINIPEIPQAQFPALEKSTMNH